MGSKSNPDQLSIKRLLNTSFENIYQKLIQGENLNSNEAIKILSIAVILVNQLDVKLNRLAYRIVLLYGNSTGDYVPLYDISINTGLIPVANLIKEKSSYDISKASSSKFIEVFTESFINIFREENIVKTEQQLVLGELFNENIRRSMCVVAPTSYGKSELIVAAIREHPNEKFCVLVPSKSLLAQTKKRLLDAKIGWVEKIITHPDMHEYSHENAVYVLTQERLSRLLNIDRALSFDFLFVDEAHNLLEKDSRNELLATVIIFLNYRNQNIAIKYLTPFF